MRQQHFEQSDNIEDCHNDDGEENSEEDLLTMNQDHTLEELREIQNKWILEQDELKKQLILQDQVDFDLNDLNGSLKYVAGVDSMFY